MNTSLLKTLITAGVMTGVLAACDSNPVGPEEAPAPRTEQHHDAITPLESAPILNFQVAPAPEIAARDTVKYNNGGV